MSACVCGNTIDYRCCTAARHMPSWQLAYWWPQSLQHITAYVQSAKFARWLQYITSITPNIYHHVQHLLNTLTITLNLSPTLTINSNTNHNPNPNKIIISPTALRIALVTPCKSVCTYTVTHSDQRSERCVKIDRFISPIWTCSYRSNDWVGQSMSPKRCGLINHPEKVSSKYWVPVLKVKAGIVRSMTLTHMATLPVRSYKPNQAITHCLKRVLLGLLKDPQIPQATTQVGRSVSVSTGSPHLCCKPKPSCSMAETSLQLLSQSHSGQKNGNQPHTHTHTEPHTLCSAYWHWIHLSQELPPIPSTLSSPASPRNPVNPR